MPVLEWSDAALEELAEILVWIAVHRGAELAETVRAEAEVAALAAAETPLRYPWVGSIFRRLAEADRSYRRVLAWGDRLHLFFRYLESKNRVVVLHVRGTRRRPLAPSRLLKKR